MSAKKNPTWSPPATRREILRALERARSRLAVAMAAETKKTPRARWELYFETEERMRRCLRMLRRWEEEAVKEPHLWRDLVTGLQLISHASQAGHPPPAALQLCRQVRGIVEVMESILQPED